MQAKWVILGGAMGLAVVLVVATLFLGRDTTPTAAPVATDILPGQTPPPLTPGPGSPGPGNTQSPSNPYGVPGAAGPAALGPRGKAQGYALRTTTRRGETVEVTGQTFDQLPQGRWNVSRPLVRIIKGTQRLVQIQAEAGTILAPENQPRSGELQGNVTVLVFEHQGPGTVDGSYGSPDLTMRVRLDDARFDLELGQIDSDGPVEVTRPQLELRGRGLALSFNPLRQRVDHLEIFTGEVLRIHMRDGGLGTPTNPALKGTASGGMASTKGTAADTTDTVYYQAQMLEQVEAVYPGGTMRGDALALCFGVTPREGKTGGEATEESGPKAFDFAQARGPGVSAGSGGDGQFQALFVPAQGDLVMHWRGRLVVEPLKERPAEMAGPEDYWLTMIGTPVRVDTANDEHIRAGRMEYWNASQRLRLSQSPGGQAVVIESPALGVLTMPELVVDPQQSRGTIVGGGTLSGGGEQGAESAQGGGVHMRVSQMPLGMSVAWSKQLDLTFYPASATGPAPTGAAPAGAGQGDQNAAPWRSVGRLGAIRSAVFHGDVHAVHPALELKADALQADFTPPAAGASAAGAAHSRQDIQQLIAQGNVRITTQGQAAGDGAGKGTGPGEKPGEKWSGLTAAHEPMTLRGEHVQVLMEAGEAAGRARPRQVTAQGNVEVVSGGRRMQAQQAVAELTAAPGATAQEEPQVRLQKLTAQGDVRYDDAQAQSQLTCEQALVQGDDTLQAWGAKEKPAQVRYQAATVTAGRINLDQRGQSMQCPVAGTCTFVETSQAGAGAAAGGPGGPAVMTVTWQQDMSLDAKTGQALFRGQVRAVGRSGRNVNTLQGEEVALLFASGAEGATAGAAAVEAGGGPAAETGQGLMGAAHKVITLGARRKVQFQAENWRDQPGGELARRLTVLGDDLLFDNPRHAVQVLGPGQMLAEDFEEPRAGAAAAPLGGGLPGGQHFANGQGATLFTWRGHLQFNVANHDLSMVDQVRMTHQPTRSDTIMQMDCSRLDADLAPVANPGNAGLAAASWTSGAAPDLTLRRLEAAGPVTVTLSGAQPMRAVGDHLSYDGLAESILLSAATGRQATVTASGQPPFGGEQLEWDIRQQRWQILRPGTRQIPLGK